MKRDMKPKDILRLVKFRVKLALASLCGGYLGAVRVTVTDAKEQFKEDWQLQSVMITILHATLMVMYQELLGIPYEQAAQKALDDAMLLLLRVQSNEPMRGVM